ncbi:MAG: hypothetical protein IPM29_12975 [Planctomycetes bacterium]|nr:hypothetical protein [Planctomycetota bacterium]
MSGDERIPADALLDGGAPDLVGHALGEGSERVRHRVRAAIAADVELAAEFAATRDVLETLRGLGDVRPTGRVRRALALAARRRIRLRGGPAVTWRDRVDVALRVAAVAVLWFGITWGVFGAGLAGLLGARAPQGGPEDVPEVGLRLAFAGQVSGGLRLGGELRAALLDGELPVADASFRSAYEQLTGVALPDRFETWLCADNLLSRLRRESVLRMSAEERARARRATGVPDLEARTAALAAIVASRTEAALVASHASGPATAGPGTSGPALRDIALGLRGLLAAGSTTGEGPHRLVVQEAVLHLMDALKASRDAAGRSGPASALRGRLDDGERIVALAALSDVAVVDGGTVASFVAAEVDRIALDTLRAPADGGRPGLLHWGTPVGALGDAGRVLQLAPAFGASADLAFRTRLLVAAHLVERLARRPDVERPDLLVAQLYGFGDLIDRRETDRRLSLWRARHLRPDFVAVHQLAWSSYPVRPGWADFQAELRELGGQPTPDGLGDAAALLLALCTNVAAPGVWDAMSVAGL